MGCRRFFVPDAAHNPQPTNHKIKNYYNYDS